MSSEVLLADSLQGAYPERADRKTGRLEQLAAQVGGSFRRGVKVRTRRWERLAARVMEHDRGVKNLTNQGMGEAVVRMRTQLHREGFREDLVAETFAIVREVSGRTIGMRHFDTQLMGGWVLMGGMVAEMETGEGKTLTATLPACTAALSGAPVHVITVNDYLASRDAEWMGEVYRALGLTVGVIQSGMDPDARRAAYACDVTYCTNKEITFDYLKDRLVLGAHANRVQLQIERLYGAQARVRRLLLRGLYFAIVDEADSVLVDEARTPLIISGGTDETSQKQIYQTALELAEKLELDRDFVFEDSGRTVTLTDAGERLLAEIAPPLGGIWTGPNRRSEMIRQAITALHLILPDKHYLVKDGKVQIIDEFTGRVQADRSWERGLHQLIELKEGCEISGSKEPLARISYQRFFRRYLRLAGMSGTVREVAGELWSVYRLTVVTVRPNREIIRRNLGDRVYARADEKWRSVVARIAQIHESGRPLLVGTRSVADSEHLSALLDAEDVPHEVLNARQDLNEAEIVQAAGERGRVTVATNMAGRGTDIKLAPEVKDLGGLHVLSTELHEAGRIDRQLFGRCGRQGDPGSFETILSLEDELVRTYGQGLSRWLGTGRAGRYLLAAARLGPWLVRRAQRTAERKNSRLRHNLFKMDERMETLLAFSGKSE